MPGQMSFAEAMANPRLGENKKLAEIDAMIDWAPLKAALGGLRDAPTGRPGYLALPMLKALYLQALYDLSDPELEAALLDRLSFRRFCGFALEDASPDETTICRFRAAAAASGALQKCFDAVNAQLEARGLVLKKGTLMDATIIKSARNPKNHEIGPGEELPQEPGATWTKKNGQSHFGYKAHIGVDEGSGLVRRAVVTGAKTYESEVADELISGDEKAVYGDKAYPLKARRERLKARGIKDRIAHRRHKTQTKLSRWREIWNKLVTRRRAPVEAPFSAMKRLYGMARARCHSLERNAGDVFAVLTVYNLRRACILGGAR